MWPIFPSSANPPSAPTSPSIQANPPLPYPASRQEPIQDILFGTPVSDPYRWLESENTPEVKQWMEAQDQLTRQELQKLPRQEALTKRFRELFSTDAISVPVPRAGRLFYTRRLANQDKAILYWRNEKGEEQIILNPNAWEYGPNTTLGGWYPSPNGRLLTYAINPNNADEATLLILNIETREVFSKEKIEGAKYATPQWTPESDGFYYTYLPTDPSIPTDQRPGYAEVRFHQMGTEATQDVLIREKTGNASTFLDPTLSRDGQWLFVTIYHGWSGTEVYYRPAKDKNAEFKPLAQSTSVLTQVLAWKDYFYILTNDGAPKWKIYKANAHQPEPEHWKLLVPESPGAVIEAFHIVGNHLVLTTLENAAHQLKILSLDGALVRKVPFPTFGSTSGFSGEPTEDTAYFSFNSYTIPNRIYQTSISTGETSLWAQSQIPVNPEPYSVEQLWYPSKDGTRISIFIVQRKNAPRDGSTPFVLTGYGGFSVSQLPAFSSSIYPWLEAGGAYAFTQLRGGGEFGEDWHQAGMLTKKQNVFDDFIAAAEFLIREKYTRPEKLAISGGSNGGLLVGAAMTQRPELFRAVICAVPLLDMIRYPLFGSGRTWIPEYGSTENEEHFRALFAYSPYHRVQAGVNYPSVLFLSSDHDDRVDPMHARKMTAALQQANPQGKPILLRIEKNAGHGGAGSVSSWIESWVDSTSFLMNELGM